jgi:hypothetical protein
MGEYLVLCSDSENMVEALMLHPTKLVHQAMYAEGYIDQCIPSNVFYIMDEKYLQLIHPLAKEHIEYYIQQVYYNKEIWYVLRGVRVSVPEKKTKDMET